MTDESGFYIGAGRKMAGYKPVNYCIDHYARKVRFVYTKTIENVFSRLKRGIIGAYHVGAAHLNCDLDDVQFPLQ